MLLSQKLNQLQDDTNQQTGFSDEMMIGFSECLKHAEKLEKAMQEFVDRVDKGEVKSKYTYAKFKELLGV